MISIWSQQWRTTRPLDLKVEREFSLNLLVVELRKGYIRIKDEANFLAWAQDKASRGWGGCGVTRSSYKVMRSSEVQAMTW